MAYPFSRAIIVGDVTLGKRSLVVSLAVVLFALTAAGSRAQGPCSPIGDAQFICDLPSPEDLVAVPQSEFVIASGIGTPGGIHAINTRDHSVTRLFPTPTARERRDTTTYGMCPGVPAAAGFRAHGLALRAGTSR